MTMQKCKSCETEFKYKALLKAFLSDGTLDCKNCGASHSMTWVNRFAIAALVFLPTFLVRVIRSLQPNVLRPSLLVVFVGYLVYLVILAVLAPYIFRYKLRDRK